MQNLILWRWLQAISFQAVWLCCVLGSNEWLAITCLILLGHYMLTPSFKSDVMVLPLGVLGIVIDMLFTKMGLFVFDSWPFWLLALWVAFVLNFGHSLVFLRQLKWRWLMLIGAMGGSYAYWISWYLGAVIWPLGPLVTTLIIAVTWAFLMPLLVRGDTLIRQKAYAQT